MHKYLFTIVITCLSLEATAQEKVSLSGYLNDMQTIYHIEDLDLMWENQVHNRMNLDIYPADWLQLSLQGRTRFIQGNLITKFPGYTEMMGRDAGWLDLNYSTEGTYTDSAGYVFTTMLDRAYIEFTKGDLVATIGRQRINWGQTFVWNPNDVFNTYSYFDVDYPERPGSDAVRLQYYTGMASNIEVAAKIDSSDRITAAAYFRFNAGTYDFQVLGGILAEEDVFAGMGWSGYIVNTSFRGEASYFRDLDHFNDTTGIFLASIGLDHTFGNSVFLQGEILYSAYARNLEIYNLVQVLGADMNVKTIGFTEWSVFSSVSYPITPLLNGSMAAMYFPDWKGFYVGPSLDISAANNLAVSLIFQAFSVELEDPFGDLARQNTFIGYARLKWSF
jgi:hypothetical protein